MRLEQLDRATQKIGDSSILRRKGYERSVQSTSGAARRDDGGPH